jgi:hypothetical protein
MQCILRMLLLCVRSYLKSVLRYTFLTGCLPSGQFLCVNNVMNRSYSSKPKRVRAETSLENTGLCYSGPISCYRVWYYEEEQEQEQQEQEEQEEQEE